MAPSSFQSALGEGYEYVVQAEQKGTGHAAKMAQPNLAGWQGPIVFVPGDAPLITPDLGHHFCSCRSMTTTLSPFFPLPLRTQPATDGSFVTRTATSSGIAEEKDATTEQRAILEVNTSIYAFDASFLFTALESLRPDNAQGEYYLTDTIAIARDRAPALARSCGRTRRSGWE